MSGRFAARILAALILGGLALYELVHDVTGRPWGAIAPPANRVGFVLVPLLAAGAVAALTRTRWSVPLTALACLGAVVHGLVLRVGDAPGGFLFLAGGVASLVLVAAASARAADRLRSDDGLRLHRARGRAHA